MVNYNRMEDVPRAFGPLEPIGPTRLERRGGGVGPAPGRRRSYAARNLVVGTAAVVRAGGALGFYFRPDIGEEPARGGPIGAPPEPASGEGVDIMVAEGPGPVLASPAELPPAPVEVSYAEIADAAIGAGASALPLAPAPRSSAPPAVVADRPGPFAAARRAFNRMTSAEPPSPTPARTTERRPASVVAPQPQRTMTVARNDAAPAPVQPRFEPRARAPEPLVIARADPPKVAPVREPEAAAFDCDRARSAGARTVCERPELAALDRRMQAEFERAVAAGHDRAALSLDQDSWLAKREAAAPDPRAVAEAYERRIRQLRSMQ